MRRSVGIGVSLVILVDAGVAAAQSSLVLDKLNELNSNAPQPAAEQMKAAVVSTAKALAEARGTCVPSEVTLGDITPVTGSRDVLNAVLGAKLRNGWSVYATHVGCNGGGPFRYMVVQKPDNSLIAVLVNEGRSYASPSIMRDTSLQAALAGLQTVKRMDPDCDGRDMTMGATRIVDESDDLGPDLFGVRYTGSWSEAWRFKACGHEFEVPVQFRADGDGGAYTSIEATAVRIVGER